MTKEQWKDKRKNEGKKNKTTKKNEGNTKGE